jgi:very-short-patch-repair endonuclease
MEMIHNNKIFRDRRRELRANSTPVEEILWFYLRDRKLGSKFKRQHSIGGYIVDFYCSEKKLIIELDGVIHDRMENKEYDLVRDKYLNELGYHTIRFRNTEVEKELGRVLCEIKKLLNTSVEYPSPSQGEGKGVRSLSHIRR